MLLSETGGRPARPPSPLASATSSPVSPDTNKVRWRLIIVLKERSPCEASSGRSSARCCGLCVPGTVLRAVRSGARCCGLCVPGCGLQAEGSGLRAEVSAACAASAPGCGAAGMSLWAGTEAAGGALLSRRRPRGDRSAPTTPAAARTPAAVASQEREPKSGRTRCGRGAQGCATPPGTSPVPSVSGVML